MGVGVEGGVSRGAPQVCTCLSSAGSHVRAGARGPSFLMSVAGAGGAGVSSVFLVTLSAETCPSAVAGTPVFLRCPELSSNSLPPGLQTRFRAHAGGPWFVQSQDWGGHSGRLGGGQTRGPGSCPSSLVVTALPLAPATRTRGQPAPFSSPRPGPESRGPARPPDGLQTRASGFWAPRRPQSLCVSAPSSTERRLRPSPETFPHLPRFCRVCG